jgi:hypothetical protein
MPDDWTILNDASQIGSVGIPPHHEKFTHPQPIRQLRKGETNPDLLWMYFDVLMIDGQTYANDEQGNQPFINICGTGWNTVGIGPLETIGFGNYRSAISTINTLGIVLARYIGLTTLESHAAPIEIIEEYRQSNIFNQGDSPALLAYVTLQEAENYFSSRYKSKAWEKASTEDKLKTLVMATKDIDKLAFQGVKTSEYRYRIREFYIPGDWNDPYYGLSWVHWAPYGWNWDDRRANTNCRDGNFRNDYEKDLMINPWVQELEFPRNGDKIVPTAIKEATCEIAYQYLNGWDMELEIQSLQITYQSFSNTRDGFDRRFIPEHVRAGINSAKAWILLRPLLRDRLHIRTCRVS